MHKKALLLALLLLHPLLATTQIQVGADQLEHITKLIGSKKVGLATNHTSILSNPTHTHLLDTLLLLGVNVTTLYTPEHGLRGTADAGAKVASGLDPLTHLPIVSLYGKQKKPTPQHLANIEVMLYDMQDVGVRFYTYISTLYHLMEACAENQIPIVVLDRPNPHDTIDGPTITNKKYHSFIGIIPIPAVHGLTLGEAAQMMNGERWLKNGVQAELTVITVKGWQHGTPYSLPIPPSPNLKSDRAIALYPTTCFIEGTTWSEGRGTNAPFEQIGYPHPHLGTHQFTPKSNLGATNPKHKNKTCYGPNLHQYQWQKGINLQVLIDAAHLSQKASIEFFLPSHLFDLIAGTDQLRKDILAGKTAHQIRASWQKELLRYKAIRQKYLLYPDYPTPEN